MQYNINRPWESLDPWQEEYIFDENYNEDNFLLTGRQCGKTTAMSLRAVEICVKYFKPGEFVLINSITEKQAYHMLNKALIYAREKYNSEVQWRGKDKPTMHRIIFKNGTGILCYAAGEKGEGQRGFTIKKLMVDEGARMSEEYFVASMPMLSVIGGSMDIGSTPAGKKNMDGSDKFFYKCSKDEKFKKYYISAEDCPRHSKEFLSTQRKRMTKLQYAQEYLAQFLDDLRQFFPSELINNAIKLKKEQEEEIRMFPRPYTPKSREEFYLGVDFAGYGGDENAFVVVKKIGKDKIEVIEISTTSAKEIQNNITRDSINRIKALEIKYKFKHIYVDDGGLGSPIFDMLKEEDNIKRKITALNNAKRSLDYEGLSKKAIFKIDLYGNLLRLFEHDNAMLLDDIQLKASLQSIQYDLTDGNGIKIFGSYSHLTEALVRAAWCVKDKHLNLWIR